VNFYFSVKNTVPTSKFYSSFWAQGVFWGSPTAKLLNTNSISTETASIGFMKSFFHLNKTFSLPSVLSDVSKTNLTYLLYQLQPFAEMSRWILSSFCKIFLHFTANSTISGSSGTNLEKLCVQLMDGKCFRVASFFIEIPITCGVF